MMTGVSFAKGRWREETGTQPGPQLTEERPRWFFLSSPGSPAQVPSLLSLPGRGPSLQSHSQGWTRGVLIPKMRQSPDVDRFDGIDHRFSRWVRGEEPFLEGEEIPLEPEDCRNRVLRGPGRFGQGMGPLVHRLLSEELFRSAFPSGFEKEENPG
ncbi:hypothetical protein BOX24_10825 [Leptospirillum ferriphilum]|jgi:hypothetical protein|uniref:Uncharacterized protein n=1 Tax=Leptospirillum ferriphilum TaxID=178606 RepID=A0A1V3SSM0_9BACT|nr:hypothetical protein BOX24_10825 [Leptospirillum ferriphilum]